jgi:eukaryotic-like serine/threonine-protein kinase
MSINRPVALQDSEDITIRLPNSASPASGPQTPIPRATPCLSHEFPARLGHYDVIKEIARGGMGIVLEGYDPQLRRRVAIKIPRPGWLNNSEILQRFHLEAEAMAKLQHVNIVAVHEVGWHEHLPFVAVEYLSGGNLHDRIQGRPLRPREAADLLRSLAGATAHAHTKGVVHRDLKPANVLFTGDNVPRIIDFGAARFTMGDAGEADSALTQVGTVIGTPQYMSPEQASGDPSLCGPAADIYSLGAILYELLTGIPPFNGVNPYDILQALQTKDVVPPRLMQPKVPRDLETICMKCLEKDPRRRYLRAEDLQADLDRYLAGEPIQARPAGPIRRLGHLIKKNPSRSGMVVGLVAAGIVGLLAFGLQFQQTLIALDHANIKTGEAQESNKTAQEMKREALLQLGNSEWNLFRTQIAQIQKLIENANILTARKLLYETNPKFRNWEWGYFNHLSRHEIWSAEVMNPDVSKQSPLWIHQQAMHPSGEFLATFGNNPYNEGGKSWLLNPSSLVIIHTKSGEILSHQFDFIPQLVAIMYWRDPNHLILIDVCGNLHVWSLSERKLVSQGFESTREGRKTLRQTQIDSNQMLPSPNGELVLKTIGKGEIEIFDPIVESSHRALKLSQNRIQLHAVSADCRFATFRELTEGGEPNTETIFDLKTGETVFRVPQVQGVSCFSPDSRWFLTVESRPGDLYCYIHLWNTETWKLHWVQRIRSTNSGGVHFSPDSRWFSIYNGDVNTLRCFFTATGDNSVCTGHEAKIRSIQASPDGRYLATGSDDSTARIWDPFTGRQLAILRGNQQIIRSVVFSKDGHRLFTGSSDQRVVCWELARSISANGLLSNPRTDNEGTRFGAMSFSEDGKLQVFDTDKGLLRFDRRTGNTFQSQTLDHLQPRHAKGITDSQFSADGARVCGRVKSPEQSLGVWDAKSGKLLRTFEAHFSALTCSALSRDGQRVCAAGQHTIGNDFKYSRVVVWSVATGEILFEDRFEHAMCNAVQFATTSDQLAVGFTDKPIDPKPAPGVVLFSESGERIAEIHLSPKGEADPTHRQHVNTLCFDPLGQFLAINTRVANELLIYRIGDSKIYKRIPVGRTSTNISVSPDGKRLAITGYSSHITLYDTATWQDIVTLVGTNDRENDYAFPAKVTFSQDGLTLASRAVPVRL